MKKTSSLFSSIIFLLVYLVYIPIIGAVNKGPIHADKQTSYHRFHQDKQLRLADLPAKVQAKISQHLQKSEYEVSRYERKLPSGKTCTYRAVNRKQDMTAYFTGQAIHLIPNGKKAPDWHFEMTLSGYGFHCAKELIRPALPNTIKASGHRIEYHRGKITEWYVNDERGFEQGVTIKEPPIGKKVGPLVVEWSISGSLMPRLEKKGTTISFSNNREQSVLRFSGLKAWDSAGRSLPAKFAVPSNRPKDQRFRIAYVIDASDAYFPVIIDPLFTQVKKITASDSAANDNFGYSVSISDDTVVVGAIRDDNENGPDSGSAYIFDRDQGGPDNWGQVTKIIASDGAAGDWFGCSVSISEDTVVVGAYFNDNGPGSGSAYIFYRDQGGTNNWGQVKKITASDSDGDERFGHSVSISGDTVVIGAYSDDINGIGNNAGSAYIFYRNMGDTDNWGQVKKITASDAESNDCLGYSVSVSGDTLVVGAPYDDDSGTETGSAYIFYRDYGGPDDWGQVKKITASDGEDWDWFGWSVSVSGDTVVVGAVGENNDNGNGSAYIFDRNMGGTDNWGQVKKITASDGYSDDRFGESVFLVGDIVVVGADQDDDNGRDSGSAYIFYRDYGDPDNWGQVKKITASDGAEWDRFGLSVSISDDTVVVGAYYDDDYGPDSGSAYVFNYSIDEAMPRDIIVFASERDGNGEIYKMNPDGSMQTNLTNNTDVDLDPSLSSDGSKIVFESWRDGQGEIYIMNSDGTEQINLTYNLAEDYDPSFSPDGSKIAFASNRDGNWEIYVMNVDGSNQTNLSENLADDRVPSFSPDGSKIAFASNRDGNWEIYVMNVDGSNLTNVTNNTSFDYYPSFSSDGLKVSFTSDRDGNYEIYVMNIDGSNQNNVTNNPAGEAFPCSFSPDGSKIAFTSDRDGNYEIYVMNVDGSNQIRLTNNSETDRQPSWGISVSVCKGDFEPDGDVDGQDLAAIAADIGRTDCDQGDPCQGNFDGDNDVDDTDMTTFSSDFGRIDCQQL